MAIRVLMYGLGPIGAAVARQVASRKGFQIVGAVDIDRNKVGLDLGQVIGLDKKLRVGEVANWIEFQVLPTRVKRGRG